MKFCEKTTMIEIFKSLLKQNFHEKVLTIALIFFKQYKLIETMPFININAWISYQFYYLKNLPA